MKEYFDLNELKKQAYLLEDEVYYLQKNLKIVEVYCEEMSEIIGANDKKLSLTWNNMANSIRKIQKLYATPYETVGQKLFDYINQTEVNNLNSLKQLNSINNQLQ